ncbi:mucin-5AC-like [Leptopilina heterotoma]|uniref:mucin-5AC-like n=1 Tax=Leptopilina heterotoma TaxID=63436 RepID=UPI001CA923A9|nr:mucin-5AC-like [Leptopilina heterotoma]
MHIIIIFSFQLLVITSYVKAAPTTERATTCICKYVDETTENNQKTEKATGTQLKTYKKSTTLPGISAAFSSYVTRNGIVKSTTEIPSTTEKVVLTTKQVGNSATSRITTLSAGTASFATRAESGNIIKTTNAELMTKSSTSETITTVPNSPSTTGRVLLSTKQNGISSTSGLTTKGAGTTTFATKTGSRNTITATNKATTKSSSGEIFTTMPYSPSTTEKVLISTKLTGISGTSGLATKGAEITTFATRTGSWNAITSTNRARTKSSSGVIITAVPYSPSTTGRVLLSTKQTGISSTSVLTTKVAETTTFATKTGSGNTIKTTNTVLMTKPSSSEAITIVPYTQSTTEKVLSSTRLVGNSGTTGFTTLSAESTMLGTRSGSGNTITSSNRATTKSSSDETIKNVPYSPSTTGKVLLSTKQTGISGTSRLTTKGTEILTFATRTGSGNTIISSNRATTKSSSGKTITTDPYLPSTTGKFLLSTKQTDISGTTSTPILRTETTSVTAKIGSGNIVTAINSATTKSSAAGTTTLTAKTKVSEGILAKDADKLQDYYCKKCREYSRT